MRCQVCCVYYPLIDNLTDTLTDTPTDLNIFEHREERCGTDAPRHEHDVLELERALRGRAERARNLEADRASRSVDAPDGGSNAVHTLARGARLGAADGPRVAREGVERLGPVAERFDEKDYEEEGGGWWVVGGG